MKSNNHNNNNDIDSIRCTNCGGIGHISKRCNFPLISCGVICYRLVSDVTTTTTSDDDNKPCFEYLMVQRKDSLCYVEFIRGKYNLSDKRYIMLLISSMTDEERERIVENDFDYLWKSLWQTNELRSFLREYNESHEKFYMLKNGIYLQDTNNMLYLFNFKYIIKHTASLLYEQEWGFPKGRRNLNETDYECAMREFYEETGIKKSNLISIPSFKPVEEIFSGSNNVRYKHIYYISQINPEVSHNFSFNPNNKEQVTEIKDMQWFNYDQVLKHINSTNVERRELFKRVDRTLKTKLFKRFQSAPPSLHTSPLSLSSSPPTRNKHSSSIDRLKAF